MAASSVREVDEADGAGPAAALDDRVEDDGGADAGERGDDLEEATPEDAGVAAGAEDEVGRVVQNAVVEAEGGGIEKTNVTM